MLTRIFFLFFLLVMYMIVYGLSTAANFSGTE